MQDWEGMVASIRERVEEELMFVFDSTPACETRRVAEVRDIGGRTSVASVVFCSLFYDFWIGR